MWVYHADGMCESIPSSHRVHGAERGKWHVIRNDDNVVLYATCDLCIAQHPATVESGDWYVFQDDSWVPSELLFVLDETFLKRRSRRSPLDLTLVGGDFFLRYRCSFIIWFIDPVSGEVVHSGSKQLAGRSGFRYCPHCDALRSSNNFVYQHMRRQHPEEALPGQMRSERLGELIGVL